MSATIPSITDAEILAMQAVAANPATYDHSTLCDTYEALGFGRSVPVLPTADAILAARMRLVRRRGGS